MQVFAGRIYLTDGTVIVNLTIAVFGNSGTLDEWLSDMLGSHYDGWGMTRIV